jgi:hypothetical protein
MPRPSQVHIATALQDISIAYRPTGLIADIVSPMVPVKHESDQYFVYSKDNFRINSTIWADGSPAPSSQWNVSTSSYTLQRHGLRALVTDRMVDNADMAIKPDIDTTEGLTHQILLRKEWDLLRQINSAASWAAAQSMSSTQVWTAQTDLSYPITFIDSATTSIRRRAGLLPNVITLPHPSFLAAKEHPTVKDRVKYTSAESITPDMFARLAGLEKCAVSGAIMETAMEGAETTTTLVDVATDCALVLYAEQSPGLRKPSAFYQFVKEGNTAPARVRKYRDDEAEGDWIEVSSYFTHKIVSSDCAYHINNLA